MSHKTWSILAGYAILAAVWGCSSQQHAPSAADDQRKASFGPFRDARIGSETFDDFVRLRTAVLITGKLPVEASPGSGRTITVHFGALPNQSLSGPSHAAAIAHDGYFLTSGHCVLEGIAGLVYWDGAAAQLAEPRVVAQIFDRETAMDIALLHVDAQIPCVFDWSAEETLFPGTQVAGIGCDKPSTLEGNVFFWNDTCFGGKIRKVYNVPMAGGAEGRLIWNDLPMRFGDSGGPMIAADGRLVAINSHVHVENGRSMAASFRPDIEWLRKIIKEDRAHPAAGPVPRPFKPGKEPVRFVISL
jgi:S1-C subfamily serine protease